MKLRYIGALVVSLFAHNVMAQSCIGDDYEQPASSNVTLPTIRITPNPVVLTSSNPFLLGTTSTVAAGGTPFYYWCVDQGTLSKDTNYPNYNKVLFTPPANMASPATVYVRIGDGFGHIADDSASVSMQLTVPNGQPSASFTATPTQGIVPLAITLDASASTDPEGKALTYEWTSQPALTIPAEKAPKLTLSQAGTYTFNLTVKDDKGLASASVSKMITVAANSAPTANFTLNSTTGTAPLTVSVTQNSSTDTDGLIAKYEWKTSDNQVSTAITPSFTFASAGDYNVTLTVTDDKGAVTNSTAQKVTVSAPTTTPPPVAQTPNATEYQFVAKFGEGDSSGIGRVNQPYHVALDGLGNIYVTNYGTHNVQKFTTDGQFIAQFGSYGSGDGQLVNPKGIAVDSAGNVYVVDSSSRVQKFDKDGRFLSKWGSFGTQTGQIWYPNGIAVDQQGNVYVADDFNRVQKFTNDGQLLLKIDQQISGAQDIALDSAGNIYVAQVDSLIQKFSSNGQFLAKWNADSRSYGIGVDSADNVYVSNYGTSVIQKFTSDGQLITKWGSPYPVGVAVDKAGSVYIAEHLHARIQKFAPINTTPTTTQASRVYVANHKSNNVSVIDPSNNNVLATIPVGIGPFAVTASSSGDRVYVINSGGSSVSPADSSVSVIDTSNNKVIATIAVGTRPAGAVINPAGTRIYIPNALSNNVSVIDTSNNTVVATIPVGSYPGGVAINPLGTRLYVTNQGNNNVSVIDTSNNAVIATIPVGSFPWGISVNPSGSRVYVANIYSNNVSVIDTSNNTVIATIATGNNPWYVPINSAGTRVYTPNDLSNTISVIDTSNNSVVSTIPVGSRPWYVAINASGTLVYVANSSGNNINVIDTSNDSIVATIPVGSNPVGIAVVGSIPAATTPIPTTYSQKITTGGILAGVEDGHTCAIIGTDNAVSCWGHNVYGQSTPPSGSFSQVSAGFYLTCGVRTNGSIACWGKIDGDNPPSGNNFLQVEEGLFHACALKTDGIATCWLTSRLANDARINKIITPPNDRFSQIAVGAYHACGIRRTDNSLICWGDIGDGSIPMPPSGSFIQIDADVLQTCGVKTDGSAVCWGGVNVNVPSDKFSQISAGSYHGCGIRTDGTMACWGLDQNGMATPIAGNFTQISVSQGHNCAIRVDGTIACWGDNYYGQLNVPVANQAPTAKFTVTPEQGTVPLAVTLDASTSTDPEGKALTYEWTSQPAVTIPAEKAPKLTLSQAGTYTFSLTVKDDKGLASEKVSKTVTVAEIPKVTLTVTQPVNGEITATNITCGTDCTESYTVNTPVTLTAKPAANFVVDSWTGCVASADKQTCQVTVDVAKTVSVTFKPLVTPPPAQLPPLSPQCADYRAEYSLKTKTLTLPVVALPSVTSLTNTPTGKTELFKVTMKLAYKSETRFRVVTSEIITGTIQLKPECPVPTYIIAEERAYIPEVAVPTFVTLGGKTIETGKVFYKATLKWLSTNSLFEIETATALQ